jgi:hypothetical protein
VNVHLTVLQRRLILETSTAGWGSDPARLSGFFTMLLPAYSAYHSDNKKKKTTSSKEMFHFKATEL